MNCIFISYRRADTISTTGRIYDYLVRALGADSVFKDVDDIPLGADFRTVLERAVGSSDVLLVIIGRQWATITSGEGHARLHDPADFVRIEVESGLSQPNILVIPVLVDDASMPEVELLPDTLKPLVYRNAASVRHDPDFHRDMARLLKQLQRHFAVLGQVESYIQQVKALPLDVLWREREHILVEGQTLAGANEIALNKLNALYIYLEQLRADYVADLLMEAEEFIYSDNMDVSKLSKLLDELTLYEGDQREASPYYHYLSQVLESWKVTESSSQRVTTPIVLSQRDSLQAESEEAQSLVTEEHLNEVNPAESTAPVRAITSLYEENDGLLPEIVPFQQTHQDRLLKRLLVRIAQIRKLRISRQTALRMSRIMFVLVLLALLGLALLDLHYEYYAPVTILGEIASIGVGEEIAFTTWTTAAIQALDRRMLYIVNADGSLRRLKNLGRAALRDITMSWSPDGSQIAVGDGQGIYIMNADGSNERFVSRGRNPRWSPDANQLLFSYLSDLYVVDANGQNRRNLSDVLGDQALYAEWSPDGNQIAFNVRGLDNHYSIAVMNTDGSNQRQLTSMDDHAVLPKWSPDGAHIAFVRVPPSYDSDSHIYIMNADGSNMRSLASTAQVSEDAWESIEDLAWSPDGRRISWTFVSGFSRGILVMDADGSNMWQVPSGGGISISNSPVWSPDGNQLAFTALYNGLHTELFVIDVGGNEVRRLTDSIENGVSRISWRPRPQT